MLTPFGDIDRTLSTLNLLEREMNRAFFGERPAHAAQGQASPAIDIDETDEAFVLHAELPGLGDDDVHVSVENNAVELRGERKTTKPEGYVAHLRERVPCSFSRKLGLGARIDADRVTATMKDGVLTVRLPKAAEARPRQITVKVS